MSQIDVTSKSRLQQRTSGVKARIEDFLRAFEWTWTSAMTFSIILVFFLLISTSIMPSFWMYYAEQKIGWAGPTDIEAALRQVPTLLPGGQPAKYDQLLLMIRDGVAMGMTTMPFVLVLVISAAMQNWRRKLRGGDRGTRPTGGYR
ncbi:MAG: hypothetical protein M3O29_01265 [Actinomycetota bacterium]|nr:hypothetical protein [Actinomycetota bacterium]